MSHGEKPAIAISALVASHAVILLAGFFAPYGFDEQNRNLAFAPPNQLHFLDAQHHFHLRPFIYQWTLRAGSSDQYQEDRAVAFPIRFFAIGNPYSVLGIVPSRRHLFGVDGAARLFLMGSDGFGRDEFSRLLYGGRASLFAGILAALISLSIGSALGGLSGYYGHWVDEVIMRASEVFMTIPWLYLLLFVRAFLPLQTSANGIFLLLIAVLGLLGWARPARLVRGVVLSAKERDYVLAAKGFGASDLYLLRKHILPHASGVVAMQMALYIPQYILAEVTLSFFGLGVSEPAPSWGNMLAGLRQYFVLESCWWMFAPAFALIAVFLAYHRLFSYYARGTPQF
jgi:peptide/nickel transport system permease protein